MSLYTFEILRSWNHHVRGMVGTTCASWYIQSRLDMLCSSQAYHASDIIDDNGCLSSSVVHWGQTVVAFLACCVPDLKLDCCVIKIHCLSQEGSWKENQQHVHVQYKTSPNTYVHMYMYIHIHLHVHVHAYTHAHFHFNEPKMLLQPHNQGHQYAHTVFLPEVYGTCTNLQWCSPGTRGTVP